MRQSILERSFEPTDQSLIRFLNEVDLGNETIGDIERVKILFVDLPIPKIISYQIFYLDNKQIERPNIHELLGLKAKLTYHDCLIISTLYFSLGKNELIQLICKMNPSLHFRNGKKLFGSTNGYLIFSNQFELLVKDIFDIPDDEAVMFRKEFNKGRIGKLLSRYDQEKMKKLITITNDCIVTNNVYKPFYNGANVLIKYLVDNFTSLSKINGDIQIYFPKSEL